MLHCRIFRYHPVDLLVRPQKIPAKSLFRHTLAVSYSFSSCFYTIPRYPHENKECWGRGRWVPPAASFPKREALSEAFNRYCTGGGVIPMKLVPRNLPVGPNFQL